jgi:CheY-like chemotaxis protein
MIDSVLLVDDETLFHLVFEDTCSLLDISLSVECVKTSEEAIDLFEKVYTKDGEKPDCVFVDFCLSGSGHDGVDLVRKINYDYGNGVVIGIISDSIEPEDQYKAMESGAQFWIIKNDHIEHHLQNFIEDFEGYKKGALPFKVYT